LSIESRGLPSESSIEFPCSVVRICSPSTIVRLAHRGGSLLACLLPSGSSLPQSPDILSELAGSGLQVCTSLLTRSTILPRLSPNSASPFPHTMSIVLPVPLDCCSSACYSMHRLRRLPCGRACPDRSYLTSQPRQRGEGPYSRSKVGAHPRHEAKGLQGGVARA
jgi:hypothetical protein